jgi:hypothetical protein
MAEARDGHVKIDGRSYKVILDTYRVRDVSDFSPRATTPGGGIIFSEMALYQPLNQTDWRHGFGFHWHTDASGYQESIGNIDTRHSGIAMLSTARSARKSTAQALYGGFTHTHNSGIILDWSGASGGSVQSYNIQSDTWATIAALNVPTNYCWTNGTYTFACLDGARLKKSNATDLATWTDAGVDADATDFKWLIGHDGFVYAGKDGTNRVHYGSAVDLSDMEGAADDPAAILVGPAGRSVLGAVSFMGDLYFYRYDGMFRMDKDRSAARRVLDFNDQVHPYNFASVCVFNGSLYFPIRNQLYQWNGTRVALVTPSRLTDVYPYVHYTKFDNLNVVGNFLYMTAKTSDANNYYDLLCFDGVGWHRLQRLTTVNGDSIGSMRFLTGGTVNDWLWFNHFSLDSGVSGVYYIPLRQQDEFPYASFPTTGTHSLITSKFDAGFRRIIKSTPSLLVEANNLSAGHYYLKVYYRLDNATDWTAWGGTDGTTNLITTSGVTELTNPTGAAAGSTIEYYWIQFRVDFITDTAAQSPILEGLTLRLLMRPNTNYGFSFDILLEQDFEFGVHSGIDRDPYDMLQDLRAVRDSKAPILFTDIFGYSHKAYMTSINELATEWKPEGVGQDENIQHRVTVNLVEV